jgi:succinate dehydrogenase / fumarate reductase membrane anchor subunit
MSLYSRSGRPKPSGSRRELVLWYLMRVTGLALFVLALAHYLILHFVFDPAEQDVAFITDARWSQSFWRALDWTLLMLVLFHGFIGVRTVIVDHVHRPRLRRALVWIVYGLAVVLLVLGTNVVLTLPAPGSH